LVPTTFWYGFGTKSHSGVPGPAFDVLESFDLVLGQPSSSVRAALFPDPRSQLHAVLPICLRHESMAVFSGE
jgi:hypothetical protein